MRYSKSLRIHLILLIVVWYNLPVSPAFVLPTCTKLHRPRFRSTLPARSPITSNTKLQDASKAVADNDDDDYDDDNDKNHYTENNASIHDDSRRVALQSILLSATTTAAAMIPLRASAGKPEIDGSGQLFSPKAEMLSGGTTMTRGIPLNTEKRPVKLKPGQAVQVTYEARFIAYLSRFFLNFDPAIRTWWANQGMDDSWDSQSFTGRDDSKGKLRQEKFAEFAESVEVGLSNYFVGPYGSYASVEAAKAGLIASQPATSARPDEVDFWKKFVPGIKVEPIVAAISEDLSKQGVLNLYTLLKARYTSKAAKRQLAILFSLISSPTLQPVEEIRSVLGEADNATITQVRLSPLPAVRNEPESRTSSRRGGGYSILTPPKILVDAPPALGDSYRRARLEPILQPTSRVLRIVVVDSGQGYTVAPVVKVARAGSTVRCEACAIIDRLGHIESIIVLDPGFGYGKEGKLVSPPKVVIEAPRQLLDFRPARAVAELEYELAGVNLIDGGNGYVADDFPSIEVSPPTEDPDWFILEDTYKVPDLGDVLSQSYVSAEVVEMRLDDGRIIDKSFRGNVLSDGMVARLRRDPLELLPFLIRPQLVDSLVGLRYMIPSLPVATSTASLSPRYRAFDPIFGPIGRVPVTKGAQELSASEYTRLALSGAVCTVIVRTALNPLELVKTKIQLGNDKEVNEFALSQARQVHDEEAPSLSLDDVATDVSGVDAKIEAIGTVDMLKTLIKLRGVKSLFQSSDITFLASLVFGSLGFGATELFRRSFTMAIFADEAGAESSLEIVLLAAAALACVLTSAAATPFEVLRVKSMGLVEPKGWIEVLNTFLEDNGSSRIETKFNPKDLLPLWNGFFPTVSRELPFAVTKFLVFDVLAREITNLANAQLSEGAIPVQVGVGTAGLAISAISGAFAGVAGAFVSHPADLILTLTSTAKGNEKLDWKEVVKELLVRDGGIANLFIGLPARSVFFFLVIGLQFFLYDYVKNIFEVGSDDLSLVLDVFYAVRQGFLDMAPPQS